MIVVAGCGYLGARIATLLHEAGEDVVGLTHSAESAEKLRASVPWRVESCDISDVGAVKALAEKLGASSVAAAACRSASMSSRTAMSPAHSP